MYLDLVSTIAVNKRLVQLLGIEPAVYFAEISEILHPVFKKKTYDENGFFPVDRKYVESEINLDVSKQVEYDAMFEKLGIVLVDPNDTNRIAVNMQNVISLITDDSLDGIKKIKDLVKTKTRKGQAAAKDAGIKFNMKNAIVEPDMELKAAYDKWVEAMVDAKNCRFTKAVVTTFKATVEKYTEDKAAKLRIIEIATISSWRDASWAINRYEQEKKPYGKKFQPTQSIAVDFGEQKVATEINKDITF